MTPIFAQFSNQTQQSVSYIQLVPYAQAIATPNFIQRQAGLFTVVDFYPQCLSVGWKGSEKEPRFEPFSCLVRKANHWLLINPAQRIIRCESVELETDFKGKINHENFVQWESAFGCNIYVRGLRLWCRIDSTQPGGPPQQMWYLNAMPQCRHAGRMLKELVGFDFGFEGISETVAKLNQQLTISPLPGPVITVEQLELKLSERTVLGAFDLDESCWLVRATQNRYYLSCFRVFYLLGPKQMDEKIGVAVIAPKGIVKAASDVSQWSSLPEVMSSTAGFVLANPNLRVTTIQTVKYSIRLPEFHGGPPKDLNIAVDPTFHFFNNQSTCVYAMWVGYTICSQPVPPVFSTRVLTCRTFKPYKMSKATYEPISGCVNRIAQWLHLTGNRLITVDTCSVYHNPEHDIIHDEKMNHDAKAAQGRRRLTLFRLFIDGQAMEPPPGTLPVPKKVKSSSVCSIL